MKKITLATFKSFIKKNENNLYIQNRASFDGMVDGLEWTNKPSFKPIEKREDFYKYTLGIKGIWLVGSSQDSFKHYENDNFIGIAVVNCCGYFEIGIKK